MSVVHVKSNTVADWTGTVTVGNSTGGTGTIAATDLVRPADWNSGHNQYYSLAGNTTNASTASGTNVYWQGAGGITLAGSTGTIVVSGPPRLAYESTVNVPLAASTQSSLGQNSCWFAPFRISGGTLNASSFQIAQSFTGTATSAATAQWGQTFNWALYSKVNSTQYSSFTSGQLTMQVWNSGTSSASLAYAGSTSSSAGSNLITASLYGLRRYAVDIAQTLTENDYLFGLHVSTSSANYSALIRTAGVVCDGPLQVAIGDWIAATQNTINPLYVGRYTTTTNNVPGSVAPSHIAASLGVVPFVKLGAV
jgi:hypothetical protein